LAGSMWSVSGPAADGLPRRKCDAPLRSAARNGLARQSNRGMIGPSRMARQTRERGPCREPLRRDRCSAPGAPGRWGLPAVRQRRTRAPASARPTGQADRRRRAIPWGLPCQLHMMAMQALTGRGIIRRPGPIDGPGLILPRSIRDSRCEAYIAVLRFPGLRRRDAGGGGHRGPRQSGRGSATTASSTGVDTVTRRRPDGPG
jgi:hypothetical protein